MFEWFCVYKDDQTAMQRQCTALRDLRLLATKARVGESVIGRRDWLKVRHFKTAWLIQRDIANREASGVTFALRCAAPRAERFRSFITASAIH
jgi:hypothetical protein